MATGTQPKQVVNFVQMAETAPESTSGLSSRLQDYLMAGKNSRKLDDGTCDSTNLAWQSNQRFADKSPPRIRTSTVAIV